MVAGELAAGLCVALFILGGHTPAAAVATVWVILLAAVWALTRPVGPVRPEQLPRRERRRLVLQRCRPVADWSLWEWEIAEGNQERQEYLLWDDGEPGDEWAALPPPGSQGRARGPNRGGSWPFPPEGPGWMT